MTAPISMSEGQPEIIDYESERNGTGNLFRLCEPLTGRRKVLVTARCTAIDYAHAIKYLVDEMYPEADTIALVHDNLNTHKPAPLYADFPPEEARRLFDKLEIHDSPKHGSWLNMADIELGVLSRQCLACRIPDLATLTPEVAAWEDTRNSEKVRIHCQFTTADARVKLKSLSPVTEPINLNVGGHPG